MNTRHSIDPRNANIACDANALDYTGGAADLLVDRFRILLSEGRLRLVVAAGVRDEVQNPRTNFNSKGDSPADIQPEGKADALAARQPIQSPGNIAGQCSARQARRRRIAHIRSLRNGLRLLHNERQTHSPQAR